MGKIQLQSNDLLCHCPDDMLHCPGELACLWDFLNHYHCQLHDVSSWLTKQLAFIPIMKGSKYCQSNSIDFKTENLDYTYTETESRATDFDAHTPTGIASVVQESLT